jgi:hypothetical protein
VALSSASAGRMVSTARHRAAIRTICFMDDVS